jgi:hypothetical protein
MTRKPVGLSVPYRKLENWQEQQKAVARGVTDGTQKRKWVGLTQADKQAFIDQDLGGSRLDAMDYAEKILKARNT